MCTLNGVPPIVWADVKDRSGGAISCHPVYFGPNGSRPAREWKLLVRALRLLDEL